MIAARFHFPQCHQGPILRHIEQEWLRWQARCWVLQPLMTMVSYSLR